jgi:energy-coupling factor transporter ATP-binding protein EcfA2
MTPSNEINISFQHAGESYDFSLQKEPANSPSAESIVIAGHHYKLVADPTESAVIKEILRATSLEDLTSPKDLYNRINRTLSSPQFSEEVNSVGVRTLRSPETEPLGEVERANKQQMARMNAICRRSLAAQFRDYQAFTTFGKGEAVVIVGHSTAGKSTLIKAYLKKQPEAVEEGIDKACRGQLVKQSEKQFPNEFAIIRACIQESEEDIAILDAIFAPEAPPKYKGNIAEGDRQACIAASDKVRKELVLQLTDDEVDAVLLDQVLSNSRKGKQTIFDVLQVDVVFRQCLAKNAKLPFRIALAYCPFHKLAERQRIRNETATNTNNPGELRVGIFPFHQFADLFGPKRNDDDLVTETLTRDLVVETVTAGFPAEVPSRQQDPQRYENWISSLKKAFGSNLSEEDLIAREKDRQLNQLLEKLGFTSEEVQTVELTPRIQSYHYLLDLSALRPDQAAEILSKDARSYRFV